MQYFVCWSSWNSLGLKNPETMVLAKILAVAGLSYLGTQGFLVYHLLYSQARDAKTALGVRFNPDTVSDGLKASRKSLVDAVLGLYGLDYSNDKMMKYSPNVLFDDPSAAIAGRIKLASAFNWMKSLMYDPETVSFNVTHGTTAIVIELEQAYTLRVIEKRIVFPTMIILELEGEEGNERIIQHYDEWFSKPLIGVEAPYAFGIGGVSRRLRKIHGSLVCAFLSTPEGLEK